MDEDVTKLTDDELNAKIAESTEEVTETPAEPETPTEEPEEPVAEETETPEEAEPEAETPEDEEPKPPSRREQLRIQTLLAKMKQDKQPAQTQQPQPGVDYRNMIDADEPVYEQLNQASQDYGKAQYNAGLEQAKSIQFHTRLEIDAPKVESKYPQLNKDSEKFNPALADAVNEWYLQTTGYDQSSDTVANPNIRYSEFVEGIMQLGETIGSEKSQATAKNVAKQATQTGLRPDGSQAKRMNLNQAPEDMTNEELEAVIAQSLKR